MIFWEENCCTSAAPLLTKVTHSLVSVRIYSFYQGKQLLFSVSDITCYHNQRAQGFKNNPKVGSFCLIKIEVAVFPGF